MVLGWIPIHPRILTKLTNKARALGSYNIMLEKARKDESQQQGQRSFGDSSGAGFQRPQSMVPASPVSAGRQNIAFRYVPLEFGRLRY